jgi:hypothetical protein
MPTTIDSLDIKISASAQNATRSLNTLIVKLDALSNRIDYIDVGKLSYLSMSMSRLATSAKELQSVDTKKIGEIATNLKKFQNIDSGKIVSVGNSINTLTSGLSTLNSFSFSSDSLDGLINSLKKLGGVKASTGTGNLLKIKDDLAMFVRTMNNVGSLTFDTTNLANLINAISRLGINSANNATKNLPAVSAQLQTFVREMNRIGSLSFDTTNLSNLIIAISRLGSKSSGNATKNLPIISSHMQDFVRQLNSIGTLSFDTTNLYNLIMAISRLGGAGATNATKNLPMLSAQLQNFVRQLNMIGSLSFDSTDLSNLINAISRLGSKATNNAITNLPRLTTELNRLIVTLSRAPSVSRSVIDLVDGLARLGSQGNRLGTAGRSLNSHFTTSRRSMDRMNRSAKGLASTIGLLYAKFFLVIRAVKSLGRAIQSSMDYIENLNYFNKAFAKVASKADLSAWQTLGYKSAEAYGEALKDELEKQALTVNRKMSGFTVSDSGMILGSREKSLGINPTQLLKYQSMYAQMASSMGVASNSSAKLSQALTEIGADLASVRNMDFDKVWSDMSSGLAGMSRTWDKYGVNIRNANLQEKLNELGIKASVSALGQNEKALIRTIILLENTKYAWGDNAQTLNTGANQLRMLKSNFANLSRTIGNIFLPTITAILPYINGLVMALQRLAETIANLVGIKGFEWGGIGGGDSDVLSYMYDDAETLSDNLDNATDSAKKLKNQLMGFDEINKLSDNTDSDSQNKGLDASGLALLESAFDKVFSDYQEAWDKAFDEMDNKAVTVADRIEKAFTSGNFSLIGKKVTKQIKNSLGSIKWESAYAGAEKFGSGLAEFINGFIDPDTFSIVAETVAKSLNTSIKAKISFAKTFDWEKAGESLAESINGFFENFDFSQLAEAINVWVDGLEDMLIKFVKTLDFKKIFKAIVDGFSELDFDTIAFIGSVFALKNMFASLNRTTGKFFSHATLGFNTLNLSLLALGGSVIYARSKLKGIYDDFSIDEIKEASRDMFADWLGKDSVLSRDLGDTYTLFATLIEKPKEVGKAIKDMAKDIKNGTFELTLNTKKTNTFFSNMFESVRKFQPLATKTGAYLGDFVGKGFSNNLGFSKDINNALNRAIEANVEAANGTGYKIGWSYSNGFSITKDEMPDIIKKALGISEKSNSTDASKLGNFLKEKLLAPFDDLPIFKKLKSALENAGIIAKPTAENSGLSAGASFATGFGTGVIGIANSAKNSLDIAFGRINDTVNMQGIGLGQSLSAGIEYGFDRSNSTVIDKIKNLFENLRIEFTSGMGAGALGSMILGFKVAGYRNGGYDLPEDGWFRASKGEYFGRFDDGTSYIANNNQIERGIASGVEEAAYRGMMMAMSESNNLNNFTLQVEGDPNGMFKIIQKKANDYTIRTGMSPFPV